MSIVDSERTVGKSVRFQLTYNLKSLLEDFVTAKDRKLYEDLVRHIRDIGQEIRDDDLMQLLKEARGCISMLDGNLGLFVQVVLILKWTHRSSEVVSEYQGFLLDLCSAHNYYTKLVIDHLLSCFKSVGESEWNDCKPNESDERCMQHVHHVIKAILLVIPMSQELLILAINNSYPYLKKPVHEHETYLYSLLHIIDYNPSLEYEILKLITMKLIALDVHTPRKELEKALDDDDEMETDGVFDMESPMKVKHPIGHTLDVYLTIFFRYINHRCHDDAGNLIWDKTKNLYGNLMKVFDTLILPTHAINHSQFLLFYILGFKSTLAMTFLNTLWRKVCNPSVAPIIRQSAVCYIASLIARANYVSVSLVRDILTEFSTWVHSYIDCQDGSKVTQDIRVHGVFYATCQAMFYIIAFRYKELVAMNKGLIFLQSLNLGKIVTCRLNPLKVCQPAVASRFASVARAYQLAYCYSVMEHNARTCLPQVHRDAYGTTTFVSQPYLDSFFPFDPYLLQRSYSYVQPIYREYSENSETEVGENHSQEGQNGQKDDDIDDFLESVPPANSATSPKFSYSSSPGFLLV